MPTCSRCREVKTADDFHVRRDRQSGRSSHCKECDRARLRKYRRDNRPRLRHRARQIATGSEITEAEVAAIERGQGGTCAVCKRPPSVSAYGILHLDHDHTTGQIRGLLCDQCNKALGHFADDPARVEAGLRYLLLHRSRGHTS